VIYWGFRGPYNAKTLTLPTKIWHLNPFFVFLYYVMLFIAKNQYDV
jgi:hypothetical protein